MLRKLNLSLLILNLVVFFTMVSGVCYSADNSGYAERISTLEMKVTALELAVKKLQTSPVVPASSVNAGGQWQDLSGGIAHEPKSADIVSVSSSSKKCHFWDKCKYFNPFSKMTYEQAQAQYPDLQLCLLCVKHLVPPGGGTNLAPQGAIKSK
jgi:hypothetical protein